MNYSALVEDALKTVVRTALKRTAESGLKGEHHFYLSFRTDHPETHISEALKAQYPEEMTIVLQHQYWGLEVDDSAFAVTLSFNKVHERLHVPFSALTGFFDPSVRFGLQFRGSGPPTEVAKVPTVAPQRPTPPAPTQKPMPVKADEPVNVVSIDKFRKR